MTVTVQEISVLGSVHYDPSVNNYKITLGIMDLTQCLNKNSKRAMASYMTNIILGPQKFEKMAAIIYSVFSLISV